MFESPLEHTDSHPCISIGGPVNCIGGLRLRLHFYILSTFARRLRLCLLGYTNKQTSKHTKMQTSKKKTFNRANNNKAINSPIDATNSPTIAIRQHIHAINRPTNAMDYPIISMGCH